MGMDYVRAVGMMADRLNSDVGMGSKEPFTKGFSYNSLAHIDTLACSGTFSFDKIQQLFTIVSINHHQNNTDSCWNYC